MDDAQRLSPGEALHELKAGNRAYLQATGNPSDISPSLRVETCECGQHPFATIVTCADSRVVPEHLFMVGLGRIFVIRVAGNVIGNTQLGSVFYAMSHLGTRLVVVLGHTHCGAIAAAIEGGAQGSMGVIVDRIEEAIGAETDDYRACVLNVRHSMRCLHDDPEVAALVDQGDFRIMGAVYHIDSGGVEFLDEG